LGSALVDPNWHGPLFTHKTFPDAELLAHCVSDVPTVKPFSDMADCAAVVIAVQSEVLPQVLISRAPASAAASTADCICCFWKRI